MPPCCCSRRFDDFGLKSFAAYWREEEDMPHIVHTAIKVDDLERQPKFYEDVFGFHQTGTGYAPAAAGR
jgi:catechol-2,3-dioxygenase